MCISIFASMFFGAWSIENKIHREFYSEPMQVESGVLDIVPLNVNVVKSGKKQYEMFKPREYVRIESI